MVTLKLKLDEKFQIRIAMWQSIVRAVFFFFLEDYFMIGVDGFLGFLCVFLLL